MTQMIDAGASPQLVNDLIASAVADAPAPVPAEAVAVQPLPDCDVELIGGLVNQLEGTTITDAVIRELNGTDEEVLSQPAVVKSVSKYIQAVVGRGTLNIGDHKPPTAADFDSLLIGDRELLLLGIRRVTYGDEVELITRCPGCNTVDKDFVFHLAKTPIRKLENPADAIYGFTVETPRGHSVTMALPRAADQDALLNADDKNEGELNTLMLSRIVQKIDGNLVTGPGQVRALTIRDRRFLIEEINKRTPGPRLGEAKRTCGSCDEEFDLGLGLLDLFRV